MELEPASRADPALPALMPEAWEEREEGWGGRLDPPLGEPGRSELLSEEELDEEVELSFDLF
ncbi:MAG: hypothetical protein IJV04_00500, partial [Lachnospiraceae bacterium]|nr:hypothetical protein [Lachnospiraceae bacterium]